MNLVRAFFSQKSGDFSLNFEKGQGRHPPSPPLVTRLCILFILQGRFSTLAVTLINFFEKVIYVSLTECISALKIIWSCWYFIIKLTSRVTFSNENNVLWIILWTASFSKFFRLRKYQKRRPQFRPYQRRIIVWKRKDWKRLLSYTIFTFLILNLSCNCLTAVYWEL